MKDAQLIAHWRKGSREALDAASRLADDRLYALALFHCHLAVEKVLKAGVLEKTKEPRPNVQDLDHRMLLMQTTWSAEDRELFDALSAFATTALYDDPAWAETHATERNVRSWIDRTATFLSQHLG